MNLQKLIYWVEEGQGGRAIASVAVVLFVIVFTFYLSYKRYAGPSSEAVLVQATLAKNVSEGKGFTTPVYYLQAYALLKERGHELDMEAGELPEIYQAPFYASVLAAGLAVLPDSAIDWLFLPPKEEGYFRADFFLLSINLIFFWLSCILTWWLARQLFNGTVAWLSLGGLVFSVGIWEQVLNLSGVSLMMALVLLLFCIIAGLEKRTLKAKGALNPFSLIWRCVLAGAISGALFLTEYTAGIIGIAVLIYLGLVSVGKARWIVIVTFLVTNVTVILPWCVHLHELTGSPIGLAWHNVFVRSGDPTAEPAVLRNAWETELPSIAPKKTVNKGLDGIKQTIEERVWSGGAFVFTAFFITGLIYRFRSAIANNLRWLFLGMFAALLLLQPFLNSGESTRLPSHYFVPLLIVFGTGFFTVLMGSVGNRSKEFNLFILLLYLAVHALPMARFTLEPRRGAYFSQPYFPRIMSIAKVGLKDQFHEGFGLMSDVPAGLAWYSQTSVWAQPFAYTDFLKLLQEESMGGLYLSPDLLSKPYFSTLLKQGADGDVADRSKAVGWGAVYAGLQGNKMPSFFPMKNIIRLTDNIFILIDNRAKRSAK